MHLSEQRNKLVGGLLDASTDLKYLRSAILRKMAAPYGDGSKSNMINAETDVLPRINAILSGLLDTLELVGQGNAKPTGNEPQSVRVW
jgi:hypothetical protein